MALKIIGISIVRKIERVVIALGFAGRVGSRMASVIGTMVLGHQVDILLRVPPGHDLVVRRESSEFILKIRMKYLF